MRRRDSGGAGTKRTENTGGPLTAGLDQNIAELKRLFGQSDDLNVRRFRVGIPPFPRAAVAYLVGGVDEERLAEQIIEPVSGSVLRQQPDADADLTGLDLIEELLMGATWVRRVQSWSEALSMLPAGAAVLMLDGVAEALVIRVEAAISRSVEEPPSQQVVKGPREGFVENLYINLALLRRRLRSHDLTVKTMTIGTRTQTDVAVLHLEGVAEPQTVSEVMRRLGRINVDGILESGYLEEFIQDQPFALVPTIRSTERVDSAVGSLLEGQVLILTDGSPFALAMPMTLSGQLQVSEDYYLRWPVSSFVRFIRHIALIIALVLPASYISLISFNHEMIPTDLAMRVARGREGVAFPALVEALLMEGSFEILREAGLRMPRAIGQAISIVGVLVIGEAAVSAGVVSPLMIVVVGMTALATFAIPDYGLANGIRLARFGLMALAGSFGIFGVFWGLLALLTHLLTLRSFDAPYFAPMSPFRPGALLRDAWFRASLFRHDKRWEGSSQGGRRQAPGMRPGRPSEKGGSRG